MFTFDPPKPARRRSPAQDNAWYASTPAATPSKTGRTEQGWFASSHDLARGLEIDEVEEVDAETVRRLFGDQSQR